MAAVSDMVPRLRSGWGLTYLKSREPTMPAAMTLVLKRDGLQRSLLHGHCKRS